MAAMAKVLIPMSDYGHDPTGELKQPYQLAASG